MQTFIADIIPKLQRFSQKLDDLSLLTNQHWVVLDELTKSKNVYIFRSNNELLISANGKVEKGKWEYLGNSSLLIDRKDESYLFKHGFFDENVMALKIDGKEEYAILVNENRFEGELNSVEKVTNFLSSTYLNPNAKKLLGYQSESSLPKVEKTKEEIELTEQEKKELIKQQNKEFTLAVMAGIVILIFMLVIVFSIDQLKK